MELKEPLRVKGEIDGKLLRARERRVKPKTDPKVVVGWNGFTAWALIEGERLLKDREVEKRGVKALRELVKRGVKGSEVCRVIYGDSPYLKGTLEDYAFLIRALLTSGEKDLTDLALKLTGRALELFHDPSGGFFLYRENELPSRIKEPYDGAYRSAYSVMVGNLMELSKRRGIGEFTEIAKEGIDTVGGLIEKNSLEFSGLFLALKGEE